MTKTLHCTNFKSLRAAYLEVKVFIENEVGDTVTSLSIRIENDLGCAGDDNWELLAKFVAKYNLETTGFYYSRHFLSEGELFNSGTALLNLLLMPIYILIWLTKLLTFGKVDFTDKKLFPSYERQTLDVSFGDLVVWYVTGTYNLRKNVRVNLNSVD